MFCKCKNPQPIKNLSTAFLICILCTKIILSISGGEELKMVVEKNPEIHNQIPVQQTTPNSGLQVIVGSATFASGTSGSQFQLTSEGTQINTGGST